MVYARLRAIAGVHLRGNPEHTLQATALAHEAYLRLLAARDGPKDREHLLAIAATAMRQILADHARRRSAVKRGGGRARLPIEGLDAPHDENGDEEQDDLVALHQALERLGRADPRRCRVVELRYLGGLTVEETARALEVSERTVENDWRVARAWLAGALKSEG
jgi:RNA polymerase sigma factor (TIGR02999 family)